MTGERWQGKVKQGRVEQVVNVNGFRRASANDSTAGVRDINGLLIAKGSRYLTLRVSVQCSVSLLHSMFHTSGYRQ